jgi:two-component sensor histidine kinase
VTNSAKYGALSTLSGQLSITWESEDAILALTWKETGGPLVQAPTTRGFGTRSLMASVESQLGGQALFDWRAEGLICRLLIPLPGKAPMPELNDGYRTGAGSSSYRRVSG